jgi:hypothetical protein
LAKNFLSQEVADRAAPLSDWGPPLSEFIRTPARSARGKRPITRPMPSRRGALLLLRSSHSARIHVLALDQSALCALIGDSHHTNINDLRLAPYNRHWDTALRTQGSALLLAANLNNVVSVFASDECAIMQVVHLNAERRGALRCSGTSVDSSISCGDCFV